MMGSGVGVGLAALAVVSMWVEPPKGMQGEWSGQVRFVSNPRVLDEYCRAWGVEGGSGLLVGCYVPGLRLLVLPSGCGWSGAYARLVCHEVGHGLGWRHGGGGVRDASPADPPPHIVPR